MSPSGSPPARRFPTRSTTIRILVASLAMIVFISGCAAQEEDPAEIDRRRVRERLEETFSGDHADCILDRLDTDVVDAMLTDPDLEVTEAPLWSWSSAVRGCVVGGKADEVEEPAGSTTTTSGGKKTEDTSGERSEDDAAGDDAPDA